MFVLFAAVAFVIDRGLANSPWTWLAVLGIGVVAPVAFMWQINRAIAAHEQSRRAVPGTREKEKELLVALGERGELTPVTAAMRTSLTVEEAAKMLEGLTTKGHLKVLNQDGGSGVHPLGEGPAGGAGALPPGIVAREPHREWVLGPDAGSSVPGSPG